MWNKHTGDKFVDMELEKHLSYKKRERQQRRQQRRRQWLMENGRVIDIPGLPPPDSVLPPQQPEMLLAGKGANRSTPPSIKKRGVLGYTLLLAEITAVFVFIVVGLSLWNTIGLLNEETAQAQRQQSLTFALPTPTKSPVIDVVILPSGHKPPIAGKLAEPGEAGDIPTHLLPAINAYVPPPIPTPSSAQARRIQIPRIDVDAPIVQGMYDWEQLKRGVAQKIDSAAPGEVGNMALAAHNDIYGEIFRDLDRLSSGDEIIVSTGSRSYTYVVREIRIVKPTEVSVLEPTDFSSTTLISCYPYRVNTQRIVVFADLVES